MDIVIIRKARKFQQQLRRRRNTANSTTKQILKKHVIKYFRN